jgi:hypothetical protein
MGKQNREAAERVARRIINHPTTHILPRLLAMAVDLWNLRNLQPTGQDWGSRQNLIISGAPYADSHTRG